MGKRRGAVLTSVGQGSEPAGKPGGSPGVFRLPNLVLDCLKKDREDLVGSTDELKKRLGTISDSNRWNVSHA